jgi:hypothetical protein
MAEAGEQRLVLEVRGDRERAGFGVSVARDPRVEAQGHRARADVTAVAGVLDRGGREACRIGLAESPPRVGDAAGAARPRERRCTELGERAILRLGRSVIARAIELVGAMIGDTRLQARAANRVWYCASQRTRCSIAPGKPKTVSARTPHVPPSSVPRLRRRRSARSVLPTSSL